jgi:hypothetical protein
LNTPQPFPHGKTLPEKLESFQGGAYIPDGLPSPSWKCFNCMSREKARVVLDEQISYF